MGERNFGIIVSSLLLLVERVKTATFEHRGLVEDAVIEMSFPHEDIDDIVNRKGYDLRHAGNILPYMPSLLRPDLRDNRASITLVRHRGFRFPNRFR